MWFLEQGGIYGQKMPQAEAARRMDTDTLKPRIFEDFDKPGTDQRRDIPFHRDACGI